MAQPRAQLSLCIDDQHPGVHGKPPTLSVKEVTAEVGAGQPADGHGRGDEQGQHGRTAPTGPCRAARLGCEAGPRRARRPDRWPAFPVGAGRENSSIFSRCGEAGLCANRKIVPSAIWVDSSDCSGAGPTTTSCSWGNWRRRASRKTSSGFGAVAASISAISAPFATNWSTKRSAEGQVTTAMRSMTAHGQRLQQRVILGERDDGRAGCCQLQRRCGRLADHHLKRGGAVQGFPGQGPAAVGHDALSGCERGHWRSRIHAGIGR